MADRVGKLVVKKFIHDAGTIQNSYFLCKFWKENIANILSKVVSAVGWDLSSRE